MARDGTPDNPLAWLIRVASRKMADQYRSDEARRRREELAASWSLVPAEPVPAHDDTLTLMLMCCHPALSPGAAIPLTLRAVGGLTTREIAAAFLVPEATMAQRISRAKAKLKGFDEPFTLPPPGGGGERLRSVLHGLYLIFNEGYAASDGPDLARTDLSGEAVRLARGVQAALPRCRGHRPARADAAHRCPAPGTDRARRRTGAARSAGPDPLGPPLITEGLTLLTGALRQGEPGEYQLLAAIAALHDQAASYASTDWPRILALYDRLDTLTGNPMVALNRAVATAMVQGPGAGLALLDGLAGHLGGHHRLYSVRAHLLEQAGDTSGAIAEFAAAAARATNLRERDYLVTKAARLAAGPS